MTVTRFSAILVSSNFIMAKKHMDMEYSRIDDQLFIGTNACCVDHFKVELLDKGVTCDISLEGEALDRPYGVDCFLWLPTKDHTAPSMHNVLVGAEALHEMLRQGRTVYIHCKKGHGRAPTFLAAYYVLKHGLPVEDAIARIAAKRPEIHIEPPQKQLLESLSASR